MTNFYGRLIIRNMSTMENFETIKNIVASYNKKNTEDRNALFEVIRRHTESTNKDLGWFVRKCCQPYSNKKIKVLERNGINGDVQFSFFESISDLYYRENFHSDILYTILNPQTPKIYQPYFIEEFVKYLGLKKQEFNFTKNYEVIREAPTGKIKWKDKNGNEHEKEGYIDLLIKNENQAIIIENKINYAPDMENQLVRYMKYVDETLRIKNYSVVYLTLNKNDKKPPLHDYDKKAFGKYIEKLRQLKKDGKLIKCAIDKGKSLSRTFLTKCINRLKQDIDNGCPNQEELYTSFVYLEQYRIMLEHLGGFEYMRDDGVKLLKKIYADRKLFNLAEDFADIWENKSSLSRKSENELIEKIEKEHSKAADDFVDFWKDKWVDPMRYFLEEKLKSDFPTVKLDYQQIRKRKNEKAYVWTSPDKNYIVYWTGQFEFGYTYKDDKKFSNGSNGMRRKLRKQLCEVFKLDLDSEYIFDNDTWVCYSEPSDKFESPDKLIENLETFLKSEGVLEKNKRSAKK